MILWRALQEQCAPNWKSCVDMEQCFAIAKGGAPRIHLHPVTSKSLGRCADGERWPFTCCKRGERHRALSQHSIEPSRVGYAAAQACFLKKRQRSFSHPPQAKEKLAKATLPPMQALRGTAPTPISGSLDGHSRRERYPSALPSVMRSVGANAPRGGPSAPSSLGLCPTPHTKPCHLRNILVHLR
jgi:hypothetical protein